ncbi:hypothetical protein Anas_14385 [Armadillidium nasatum]|uniref:Lipoprotein n=1 Tax=Armadillidium nasatum TaxID=96803 RepID=A0A5N5TCR3_9CRUS|nr:hypothetical protein Anas_14385 [Armadillidium nasatum]
MIIFLSSMAKMLPIIIGILMVTNVGVRGCSIPSKMEPTKITTEKPSIATIKEPSSNSTYQPETHLSEEKDCSFPHCHVFKNGNLILFPGIKNITANKNIGKFCYPYNGIIFEPITEEDNKIWLEFTKMLYDEDKSFKEAWYPMVYDYLEAETFYWVSETSKLKIDDSNDGQPDFVNVNFNDYNSGNGFYIFFAHDNENVFGQLQFRDGAKGAGFAVCSAGKVSNSKR